MSPALPCITAAEEEATGHCPSSCSWNQRGQVSLPRKENQQQQQQQQQRSRPTKEGTSLDELVRAWKEKKMAEGTPPEECMLPFLMNAPRLILCRVCHKHVYPGQEVPCSVRDCGEVYHLKCVAEYHSCWTSKLFRCPQHTCFICKQIPKWRCVRCPMATHVKCAAWPKDMILLTNRLVVCWRHPANWLLENQHADPSKDIEEVFQHLPLPYNEIEFGIGLIKKDVRENNFKIESILKDTTENDAEPPKYTHIKRNMYLVKKRREVADSGDGCRSCNSNSTCRNDCECRGLSISCSKTCGCSEKCENRPFCKEKKIKVVKTKYCGWGVVALERMKKGDFVIEYIGEVINDAMCEQRLWDMKHSEAKNFYMCEIQKDLTIDATFKGNASRFLNHSCDPNCKLEKWQVDGETRVGVFASRSIAVGEPLTYDYRFVHFGPMVKCFCGATNCQGYLGSKKIDPSVPLLPVGNKTWGTKRKRTVAVTLPSSWFLVNR